MNGYPGFLPYVGPVGLRLFSNLRSAVVSRAAVLAFLIVAATTPATATPVEVSVPYPGARCEISPDSRQTCWGVPETATAETHTRLLPRGTALITVEQQSGVRKGFVLQEGDERTIELPPGSVVSAETSRDSASLHIKASFPTVYQGSTCRLEAAQSTVCWGWAPQEAADQDLTIVLSHGDALVTIEAPSGLRTAFTMRAGDSRQVELQPGTLVRADGGPAGGTLSIADLPN